MATKACIKEAVSGAACTEGYRHLRGTELAQVLALGTSVLAI